MRLAVGQVRELTEDIVKFTRQMGISEICFNTPPLPGDRRWEFRDLLLLRTQCEDAGLRLATIENVPVHFYDKAMLGLPGRDEQIEDYQTTIRNMGRAGIPILGYHWMPNSVWRTSRTTPARGGAKVTAFDYDLVRDAPLTHDRVFTEQEMWGNYAYFLRAVIPVAEEAGVKLALHPDDPPVPSLGGVARIFRSFDGFQRAMEVVPSDNSGLDFCQGCWSEMGEDVFSAIRYFGSRGKILYVHFRDVMGTVPKFRESFIDEGQTDMLEALRVYKEVGFDGYFIDDHVPQVLDDHEWTSRARAHAIGYMAALLRAVG